jgi:MoaA/NifB/PqqE/SkfB family radical SAM enzyme
MKTSLVVNEQRDTRGTGRVLDADQTRRLLWEFIDVPAATLAVEIVRTCNLRCSGCWVGISRDDLWSASVPTTMDDGVLRNALRFGRNIGFGKLSLLGGEPTLHPELPAIVRETQSLGYNGISLTTNGVAPSTTMRAVLCSGITNVTFSIDGSTPDVHDLLRPSPNGKSTFSVTMRNLETAIDLSAKFGYEVRVNHTLYAANIHDAENMVRLVAGKGVRKVRIHFSMPGDMESLGRGYISPKEWLDLNKKMAALSVTLGIEIVVRPVYGRDWVNVSTRLRSPYLTIQPDGNLVLCSAHARLPGQEAKSFAYLECETNIRLNPQSLALIERVDTQVCCGAVPKLVEQMPPALYREILEAGGMGCIILQGALAAR